MSMLNFLQSDGSPKLTLDKDGNILEMKSEYQPSDEVKDVTMLIKNQFALGDVVMNKPRREWNDLSTLQRMTVDQMSFNAYQPNNGDPLVEDRINGWRSMAMRPIVRNKVVSLAAHATAQLIFPKVFAYNSNSEEQSDAATAMMDLMQWVGDKVEYPKTNLFATISALVNPVSIVFEEYAEVYRTIKKEKVGGKWKTEQILDEQYSGFKQTVVPVDEFFIPNFYENDVQKQDWLIWRRVNSFNSMRSKYGHLEQFKYVQPGVQVLYGDANRTFYAVYDTNMRQDMAEEILYWNRSLDLYIVLVNGVMMTDPDNPNPRVDKLYPFATFGYELIDEGKCFYYKSLVFKMQQDAKIINTIYPMMIDGTYLNLMPPMMNIGGETIASDVIVPGAVTTLSDPNSELKPIGLGQNLKAGMDTLFKVEESINQSSDTSLFAVGGNKTAYEISQIEKEQATTLGLFIQMRSIFVRNIGRLMIGDILQHLTIADVDKITDNSGLVYKTFLIPNKNTGGKDRTRKIKFDANMPSELSKETAEADMLNMSFDVLEEQGGVDSNTELFKVNPTIFRDLYYQVSITPDVENPMSEDLKRAYIAEFYDRAHIDQNFDQKEVSRLLASINPETKSNVDKFMIKEQPMTQDQVLNQAVSGGKGFDPRNLPNLPQGAAPQQSPMQRNSPKNLINTLAK